MHMLPKLPQHCIQNIPSKSGLQLPELAGAIQSDRPSYGSRDQPRQEKSWPALPGRRGSCPCVLVRFVSPFSQQRWSSRRERTKHRTRSTYYFHFYKHFRHPLIYLSRKRAQVNWRSGISCACPWAGIMKKRDGTEYGLRR